MASWILKINKRIVNYLLAQDEIRKVGVQNIMKVKQKEQGQDLLILNVLPRKVIFPRYLF